ncbi:hypothetical protein [Virgisporangium aliadipatigenens]|uniref:hypothetical protein n=1 Tax=Virgisporangium aliadipatigenens TaxID=741659 RepID=UPI001943EEE0|nr:hypothetical protein [Virgisporangium aliadipatigenens]
MADLPTRDDDREMPAHVGTVEVSPPADGLDLEPRVERSSTTSSRSDTAATSMPRVIVPSGPPEFGPRAARALLAVLIEASTTVDHHHTE